MELSENEKHLLGMSGLCHFDTVSNNKFSVKFYIFVIVMFFNCSCVLKFVAPSDSSDNFGKIGLLSGLILMSAEKN